MTFGGGSTIINIPSFLAWPSGPNSGAKKPSFSHHAYQADSTTVGLYALYKGSSRDLRTGSLLVQVTRVRGGCEWGTNSSSLPEESPPRMPEVAPHLPVRPLPFSPASSKTLRNPCLTLLQAWLVSRRVSSASQLSCALSLLQFQRQSLDNVSRCNIALFDVQYMYKKNYSIIAVIMASL